MSDNERTIEAEDVEILDAEKDHADDPEVRSQLVKSGSKLIHGINVDDQIAEIELYAQLDPDVVEKAIDMKVRIWTSTRARIMKATNKYDWLDMGDKPYIPISGCEKYASMFGVGVHDLEFEKVDGKDEGGRFYFFVYRANFSHMGRVVPAVGIRSSRDKLWAIENRDVLGEDGKPIKENNRKVREKVRVPIEEINEPNVRKAANSNLFRRGYASILALNSVTWDDLDEAGIKRSDVRALTFGGGKPATDSALNFAKGCVRRAGLNYEQVEKDLGVSFDNLKASEVDKVKDYCEKQKAHDGREMSGQINDGSITEGEIARIRKGMDVLGISEKDFKAQFGQLPENLPRHKVKPVMTFLDNRADSQE